MLTPVKLNCEEPGAASPHPGYIIYRYLPLQTILDTKEVLRGFYEKHFVNSDS